jgi:hypothetical protein
MLLALAVQVGELRHSASCPARRGGVAFGVPPIWKVSLMARPGASAAGVRATRAAAAAPPYSPDLLAKGMIITAVPSADKVYLSASIQNIGLGRASGPFSIAMYVSLYENGDLTSEIFETFEVPASVTLSGVPVFEYALVAGGATDASTFQTGYVSPKMEVPLYYRDANPSYTYGAGFLVDADNQVTESNESNNYYTWPGDFWFMSPAARRRTKPFVREVAGLR